MAGQMEKQESDRRTYRYAHRRIFTVYI